MGCRENSTTSRCGPNIQSNSTITWYAAIARIKVQTDIHIHLTSCQDLYGDTVVLSCHEYAYLKQLDRIHEAWHQHIPVGSTTCTMSLRSASAIIRVSRSMVCASRSTVWVPSTTNKHMITTCNTVLTLEGDASPMSSLKRFNCSSSPLTITRATWYAKATTQ